jgi:hypothetical protein
MLFHSRTIAGKENPSNELAGVFCGFAFEMDGLRELFLPLLRGRLGGGLVQRALPPEYILNP